MPGQLIEAAIRLFGFLFASVEWEVANGFRIARRFTLRCLEGVVIEVPRPDNLILLRIEAAAKQALELAMYATD